jgi:hypothetical protein
MHIFAYNLWIRHIGLENLKNYCRSFPNFSSKHWHKPKQWIILRKKPWISCIQALSCRTFRLNKASRNFYFEFFGSLFARACHVDWQPLNQRYKTNKSIFMHRIRNEKMPSSISNMFKIRIRSRLHGEFSAPVNRAEIASQLHGQFEPALSFSQSYIYPL